MCENVELDLTSDTIEALAEIVRILLVNMSVDECSLTFFDERKHTMKSLQKAIGKTIVNSVIVSILAERVSEEIS